MDYVKHPCGNLSRAVISPTLKLSDLCENLHGRRNYQHFNSLQYEWPQLSAFKHSSTKNKEWEEVKKTRAEELAALADAIKVLNNDDALELFKNTLPSASASFMEITVTKASVMQRTLTTLHAL